MSLASHYDISIQLENEPVCNIGNIAELRAFFDPKEEELAEEELAEELLEEDMLALETIDGVMVDGEGRGRGERRRRRVGGSPG